MIGNGIDLDSPTPNTSESAPYWWNIIQFSEHNRLTQIANNPFSHTARLYARVKHDDNWYPWSEFALQSDVAETYPCNLKSNGHPITYADGSFEVGKLTLPKGRYLILFKAILRDAAIYLFIGSETVHSSAVRCWNKEEQTGTGFYVRTLTEETVITFKVALHLESSSPISLADDARYNMAYAIRL